MTFCTQRRESGIITKELQNTSQTEDAKETHLVKNDENLAQKADGGDRKYNTADKKNENDKISSEKSNIDESARAYYRKRLQTVAVSAEKLFGYYKMIESENKGQKDQINSILQNFNQFSEKLETLSAKTSKIKQNFEVNKKPEALDDLRPRKTNKKKSPAHFQIKAYVVDDSAKEKSTKNIDNLLQIRKGDIFSDSKLERKRSENQHHHKISGDRMVGDSDKRFSNSCQNSIETEIDDLRNIFTTLRKSILLDPTEASSEGAQLSVNSTNNEKMIKGMSDLISQIIMKIFDKMLSEESEKIKKHINAIDSDWKLEALCHDKEQIKEQLCNAKILKTVADRIENIQNRVEQISNTNQSLNMQMMEQKQEIMNLDGKLKEISSPRHVYGAEKLNNLDWSSVYSNQVYGNPNFVIAKILRSVENITDKMRNEQELQCQNEEALKQSTKTTMNKFDKNEFNCEILQARAFSPIEESNNCKSLRENLSCKFKKSNGNVSSVNSRFSSMTKKSPTPHETQFQKIKRSIDSQKAHIGMKLTAARNECHNKVAPSEKETLALKNATKSTYESTHYHTQPATNMNSAPNQTFYSLTTPFLVSNTENVSDVITKEIDKHVPELIRVSRIPKLLDEIASSVAPLTLSTRRLTHRMPNVSKRYHEVKKKSSLIKRNIFKNSSEVKNNGNKQKSAKVSKSLGCRRSNTLNSKMQKLEQQLSKGVVGPAESRRKPSHSNLFSRKESLKLYSKEFLASVKKSFVEIITNEIKKSITNLVAKESSAEIKIGDSGELNVTSVSSLNATCGSKPPTRIKLGSTSGLSVAKNSDQILNVQYDIASKTDLTSQITLDCVKKFITAVKTEKNLKKSISLICLRNSTSKIMDEKNLNSKPTDKHTEYIQQKFKITTVPSFFIALPGVKIFDSFWGSTGSNFPILSEQLGTSGSRRTSSFQQNCQQISRSNETNNTGSSSTGSCDCTCGSSSISKSTFDE